MTEPDRPTGSDPVDEPRWPGQIADPIPATPYIDTDGDGRPDTTVRGDGVDLVLSTDLDGDGYADRVLRIGPDGVAREAGHRAGEPPDPLLGDPPGDLEAG
jgi:hypothetical protein